MRGKTMRKSKSVKLETRLSEEAEIRVKDKEEKTILKTTVRESVDVNQINHLFSYQLE
jgi:hypothetical protein